jgi:hypothetical protein
LREGNPGTGDFQNTKQAKSEKNTSGHIIVKTLNIQEKKEILKASRQKQHVIYKGKCINAKARRSWTDIFQPMKENNCQPRLIYPVKLSFIIEKEIKFPMLNKN